jgi:hypothetical protein
LTNYREKDKKNKKIIFLGECIMNLKQELSFDERLMDIIRLPWIGSKFKKSKSKLLILGESHYSKPWGLKNSDRNVTRNVISNREADSPFDVIYKLIQAIYNKDDVKKEYDALVNYCAYGVIVQRILKDRSDRPIRKDYENGWKAISKIIEVLKPNNIICIGVEPINTLRKNTNLLSLEITFDNYSRKTDAVWPSVANIKMKSKKIKIISLKHTTGARNYFHWEKWHKFITKNIDSNSIYADTGKLILKPGKD